jgi:hypothetical protein
VFTVEFETSLPEWATAHFQAGCTIATTKDTSGHTEYTVIAGANLRIYGTPNPALTLATVRSVFGQETENELDYGISQDGPGTTAATKGFVFYEDRIESQREGKELGTWEDPIP